MPAWDASWRTFSRFISIALVSIFASTVLCGQQPPARPAGPPSLGDMNSPDADVDIAVRDAHGSPLEAPAVVRLTSVVANYNQLSYTQGSSKAHFSKVPPGDFEVEISCPGYRKVTERLTLMQSHSSLPVYIYLVREDATATTGGPPSGVVMSPQLQSEMEKAIDALHKLQFEAARKTLAKAILKSPNNADLIYYLGLAEIGLKHPDIAREDFQRAASLDPNHELALLSLGELQLQNGAHADAVATFEKAVATGRTTWRANFQLASAYFQSTRFKDAENEAARAVRLAKEKGAAPLFLLGEIQYAEGKHAEAKHNWQTLLAVFPSDSIVPETKKLLARVESDTPQAGPASDAALALPRPPEISLANVVEHPWAPPDIDAAASDAVTDPNCKTDEILDGAFRRMKSSLMDFEKFTATEHIEHQQIDRYGWPGPAKKHDYAYVVFVHPLKDNSFYLEESLDGHDSSPELPIPFITSRLNNLGVAVLQPFYRGRFNYSCEGLSNVRGQASWQVRFDEKQGVPGEGVRRWHRGMATFDVPVKGRIWISSINFAVLRIESDIREPVKELELTKDHLSVDYGPVKFVAGDVQLWLPWSADMYTEFKGKRYHNRHFLTDYMLFGVDTTHKIGKPAGPDEPSP